MSHTAAQSSQTGEPVGEYFPEVETHLISSEYVQQRFKVQVMQPLRRRGENVPLPVVYATDGNSTFDVLRGLSLSLQACELRDTPQFILVGIGYPGECFEAGAVLRARDMTFPGYPKFNMTQPPIEGVLTADAGTKELYGADDFLRFIRLELIPFIDNSYTTIPSDRTYFGHSLGGGFGFFTLFSQPDLFCKYIISSPGLIYDGQSSAGVCYENYDFVLKLARQFFASKKVLKGIKVYMTVGGQEEFEPALAEWQLTSSFYRMAKLLRAAAYPGFELLTKVFADETHTTVWAISFIHGIKSMFGPRTGVWRD